MTTALAIRWLMLALFTLAPLAVSAAPTGSRALRSFVIEEIGKRLPPGGSVDPEDTGDVSTITLLLDFAVHGPDYDQVRAAVSEALAAASPEADSAQLTQIALEAMIRGYGHRSGLIDLRHPLDADLPKAPDAHTRADVDGMRIAKIAHFNPANWEEPGDCSKVLELLTAGGLDDVDAMILDLRGNEGGSLVQIVCIASLFIKPGKAFIYVDMKNIGGGAMRRDTIRVPDSPVPAIKLPLVLLVDEGTDSGGMLFAASMQSLRRATLVGAQKAALNGDVFNLFNAVPQRYQLRIPTGILRRADKRPLSEGVRIDVPSRLEDQAELLRAARAALSRR